MDSRTLDLLAAFAQLDPNPQIAAVLMEFAQLDRQLVRYMAGPIVIHKSPWAESLPAWITPAIYADRAELITQEARAATIGELATPLEVVAYMYPATLDTPISYEWAQVYLYCGQTALTKHNKIPAEMTFAEMIGQKQPLELTDYMLSQFLAPLQRDLRRKAVQVAADRGVAKQRKPVKTSQAKLTPAKHAPTNQEPAPPLRVVQMSLFDLAK